MMRPGAMFRGLTDTVSDPFSADTTGLPAATSNETIDLADGGSFDLTAGPVRKRLGDAVVRMLAYNGSIPGPTLKVRQGSEVTINFTNQADIETTVHWHGLRLDNRYDGVPDNRHRGLASAASALEENAGMWAFPPIRARQEQWLATAEQSLEAAAREAAWAEGRRMSMDEVIAQALEETSPVADPRSAASPAVRERLSPREREVLGLVAQGRSNREIAEALVVTEHTAKYHVAQLLNKLGAGSRAEAVTRAVAAGLLAPTAE